MPRISIQQFRSALADGDDALVRAYRELARRPELATVGIVDWSPWPPASGARAIA